MVKRIPSDGVLKLGKKIVDGLGLDQSVDTLGHWMAHYLAEKIADAEAATGEDRNQKMSECMDDILKLWAQRSELPDGKRPFEDFEPIFRVLQSLDPDDTTPRYFPLARSAASEKDMPSETAQFLSIASGLDYTARILIRYCLAVAAREAVDGSMEWVALAEAAARGHDIDIKSVNIISDIADSLYPKDSDDLDKKKIEDIIKRLEGFTQFANGLAKHLQQQLDDITH